MSPPEYIKTAQILQSGSPLQSSPLRVTAQQMGMTQASSGSHDRALGQILARVSLSSPFCEMDKKLMPAS